MSEERWRDLCEAIMKETDPCRLSQLVEALNIELVRRERELRHVRKQPDNQDENS
jgi:hypothetical protein